MAGTFYNVTQASAYLGLSVHTVRKHIQQGHFPEPFLRAGEGSTSACLWIREQLDHWQNHRPTRPGPNDGSWDFLRDTG